MLQSRSMMRMLMLKRLSFSLSTFCRSKIIKKTSRNIKCLNVNFSVIRKYQALANHFHLIDYVYVCRWANFSISVNRFNALSRSSCDWLPPMVIHNPLWLLKQSIHVCHTFISMYCRSFNVWKLTLLFHELFDQPLPALFFVYLRHLEQKKIPPKAAKKVKKPLPSLFTFSAA